MMRSPLVKRTSLKGPVPIAGSSRIERLGLGIGADALAFLSIEGHRSGAIRLADRMAMVESSRREQRIRAWRGHHQGQRVGCRHAGDGARVDGERGGRVLDPRRAAERIDHVVGGEFGAVGELSRRDAA